MMLSSYERTTKGLTRKVEIKKGDDGSIRVYMYENGDMVMSQTLGENVNLPMAQAIAETFINEIDNRQFLAG